MPSEPPPSIVAPIVGVAVRIPDVDVMWLTKTVGIAHVTVIDHDRDIASQAGAGVKACAAGCPGPSHMYGSVYCTAGARGKAQACVELQQVVLKLAARTRVELDTAPAASGGGCNRGSTNRVCTQRRATPAGYATQLVGSDTVTSTRTPGAMRMAVCMQRAAAWRVRNVSVNARRGGGDSRSGQPGWHRSAGR